MAKAADPNLVGAVEDDLARLVAFETVSDRPTTGIASFLSERLEGMGFRIDPFQDPDHPEKGSVIARIGPEGSDGLTMSGHMDVVPTEGQPWTSDPFRLTVRGERLVGRGSADMKGFFAIVLAALDDLQHEGLNQLRRPVTVIATADEESSMSGARALSDADPLNARFAVVGEPKRNFQILRFARHLETKKRVRTLAHGLSDVFRRLAVDEIDDGALVGRRERRGCVFVQRHTKPSVLRFATSRGRSHPTETRERRRKFLSSSSTFARRVPRARRRVAR